MIQPLNFEEVKPFLKLSKSAPEDRGPYTASLDLNWYNICDRSGSIVAQVPKAVFEERVQSP